MLGVKCNKKHIARWKFPPFTLYASFSTMLTTVVEIDDLQKFCLNFCSKMKLHYQASVLDKNAINSAYFDFSNYDIYIYVF